MCPGDMADEQQQVQAERLAAMSKRRHLRQRSVRQMMDTIFYVQTGCQCALPQKHPLCKQICNRSVHSPSAIQWQ